MRPLLDARQIDRCLRRMASEIAEARPPELPIALVGIRTGGVALAARLAALLQQSEGAAPAVGAVDITLYRDDLYTGLERPTLGETDLPFDLAGTGIYLVDDVLFTGRTVRAALENIHDCGRPRFVRLAVLIDRGHRELPIQADVVGRRFDTTIRDRVRVSVSASASPEDRVDLEVRP